MTIRSSGRQSGRNVPTYRTPMIWLGQNLRNQVLLAQHAELRRAPIVVSLGDAFLRPSYMERFFTEHLREALGMDGPIMVDSGGFALLSRRSLRCSIKEISRIYARLDADILVSLDYPPSPEDDQAIRSRLRRRTLQCLERLRHTVPAEHLMPVVHGHSIGEIKRSCEGILKLCREVHHVGIGGLVPLLRSGGSVGGFCYRRENGELGDRGEWIGDVLQQLRVFFPEAFIHVFGIGSATTAIGVLALDADSTDSVSWRRAANYGAILLPGRSERFPVFRRGRVASRPTIAECDIPLVSSCKCPVCIGFPHVGDRLKALARCYKRRAIHNAWTILSEVSTFRAAVESNKECDFLKSRLSLRHRLYRPVMEKLRFMEANSP